VDARRLARAVALGGAAVAVGVAVSGGRGGALDEQAFREMNRGRGPGADLLFTGVTELGSIWASAGAAAVLAASGRRRAAAKGLAAAGITWLAGQGLKKLFLRPRPYAADPDGVRLLIGPPHATSWPSSHPAVLLSFATVAGREAGLSRTGRAVLTGLGALVGISRTYVGVHYPGDVAGGLLLGRAVADAVSDGPASSTG
jgi:membrane-associated phospholipid phosphatase